jgi:uncharacterized protein GlcG (DUF336 family)
VVNVDYRQTDARAGHAAFARPRARADHAGSDITARGFVELQGGLPVVVDGEVIGGTGASFATPEEDEQVAKAGLAALTQ